MNRKCKCLTCNHITEMEKLIPDKTLRNKVLQVTDDLYDAVANESLTLGVEIFNLKKEIERLETKSQYWFRRFNELEKDDMPNGEDVF